MTIRYSMTKWNGISKHPKFVGLDNFKQIFSGDTNFSDAAWFTIKYAVLYIIIVNVLAILLAVLLDMKLRSTSWLRAAFFIPYILSLVIVGFIWKFIFMQGFNSLGESTGWAIFDLQLARDTGTGLHLHPGRIHLAVDRVLSGHLHCRSAVCA